MRINNQNDILDPDVRLQVIKEIESPANRWRKYNHFVRHQVYKDKTKDYVHKYMEKYWEKPETLNAMKYAYSNISVARKIVDKLARVYSNGVQRSVLVTDGDKSTDYTFNINQLEKELDINSKQVMINRYLKFHRNTVMYVKPCPYIDSDDNERYTLKLQPMAPYLYDAIEDTYDRTKAMAYVLSNYDYWDLDYLPFDPAYAHPISRYSPSHTTSVPVNLQEQLIAIPGGQEPDLWRRNKEYIWWSDKYHFTTNGYGDIISEDKINPINPIGIKPIINYALDQDMGFWAEGGDDIAEGAILINSMLSHLNYISVIQGYGQLWMRGQNLAKNVSLGPTKAILMEYTSQDPVPEVGFAQANPQLTSMMDIIEMYMALLLTTNNLSTSGVSTQLSGSSNFAAGIALLIDKSESMEDVNGQRQVFIDNEPIMFDIISRWITLYTQEGTIAPNLEGLILPEGFDLQIQFMPNTLIQTESERLANLEKRKELGLNTMIELLKMDQPDLSDEQAEEKLLRILEEKMKRMVVATQTMKDQAPAVETQAEVPNEGDQTDSDDDETDQQS